MKYFLPSSLDSIKGWYPLSRELSVGRQKPENQPTGGQNGANQIARARGAKEEERVNKKKRGGEFLSEQELGAMKKKGFAPEGRRFFSRYRGEIVRHGDLRDGNFLYCQS